MELTSVPVISALWLGILTSVSPCPLAGNIAAVSFIIKGGTRTSAVLSRGVAYTLGRSLAYMALGWVISASLLNVPAMAYFLQTQMPKVLGPMLIITGLLLLGLFSFAMPGISVSQEGAEKLRKAGVPGAFVMGMLFALAFCPVSAAFFFGSLIPLTVSQSSTIALPLIYGVGTGLPVLLFALVIVFGISTVGRIFHVVSKTEVWVRRVTAVVMIAVGVYLSMLHILNVDVFA
jgi:cytochrome c-type biogenesis protein